MINTILFDLDGTLLNMDTEYFVEKYYKLLARDFAYLGNVEQFLKAFNLGYYEMVKNNTSKTNQVIFEDFFEETFENFDSSIYDNVIKFYETSFNELAENFSDKGQAKEIVSILKEKGYRLVIATNPVFPRNATISRLGWIGLDESDFELITTYDNSTRCKPNLAYYQNIMDELKVTSEECLMIGNDVVEDLVVRELGVKTYLVTDNELNRNNVEYKTDYKGSFTELIEFAKKLEKVER